MRRATFTQQHMAIKRIVLSLKGLAKFRPLTEKALSSVNLANATLAHIDAIGDGEFFERHASPYTVARKTKSEEGRISRLTRNQLITEIHSSLALLNKS